MKPSTSSLLLAAAIFLLLSPGVLSQTDSDSSDVSVEVDRKCQTAVYRYNFSGDQSGRNIVGQGGAAIFSFVPFNSGEMSFANMSLNISNSTGDEIFYGKPEKFTKDNFTETYLLNASTLDANYSTSELKEGLEDDPDYYHFHTSFSHNTSKSSPPYNTTIPRVIEFKAEYPPGNYTGTLELDYQCEIKPSSEAPVISDSFNGSFEDARASDNLSSGDVSESNLSIGGLDVSWINFSAQNPYARTTADKYVEKEEFEIVITKGKGNAPNDPAGENPANFDVNALIDALRKSAEINTSLENKKNAEYNTDALIEELRKSANISQALEETQFANYSSEALIRELNRTGQIDTDVNRTENASLDTDAEESSDSAEPKEGDGDFPGQTPEPQPQPQPEPVPLLSVTMKPLNSTYEATRGEFTEVGIEITNTGEEAISDLQMEPRFSEDMAWESQDVSIDSLEVDESMNRSVYVNPGASVDPGIYQIPVFASNTENDIGSQFVNVEVTEDPVSISALNISEAPQDIRFETNNNYTVPVLLRNAGDEDLQNVNIELQNTENCGNYTAETIESIAAGETASVSVAFDAAGQLNECEATVVASSDSGSFAFSEMTVQTVENKGIVPQEFRVPIVASLWTLMLVIYTVVTKKYGLNSLTVKIPLIILVAGEAFILIYLSSAYYDVIPPGVLPFEAAAS